ncbi:MAG: bifunctional diguanylate cyclase/phosphodiesterase [Alphaproteobacteria bacterium]|nr:bifunctional diguanylate cyclase/phosphodiesterase [Alphaproteobacteria bacterium]
MSENIFVPNQNVTSQPNQVMSVSPPTPSLLDDVTGLPNRNGFVIKLEAIIDLVGRHLGATPATTLTVLFISIEDFQDLIDVLDHALAEKLLASVAERLVQLGGEGAVTARLVGGEFAMVKIGLNGSEDESVFAETIIRSFQSEPISLDMLFELDLPISIGLARAPDHGSEALHIMHNTNLALSRARKNRARPIYFFDTSLSERAIRQGLIQLELRNALDNNELRAFYQPKISLKTGKIIGMEALMRWEHPSYGIIPPIDFIPTAERTGLIAPMTEWIMLQACSDTKKWIDAGYGDDLRVAINLSTIHFRRQSVIGNIATALEKSNIDPSNVEIEITEGLLLHEDEIVSATFSWLRDIGIHIAVDDFGVGYSSLSYLQRFTVDCLKLDTSFVSHLHERKVDAAITRGVIDLAHNLGIEVVAEGVELDAHLEFLEECGCDIGQGFYWSKPVSAEVFTKMLANGGTIPQ